MKRVLYILIFAVATFGATKSSAQTLEGLFNSLSKMLSSSESADQVASDAIDLANEVLRRLRGPVSSLSSTVEEKESLQSAIYETVRKAYIGSVLSKKQ